MLSSICCLGRSIDLMVEKRIRMRHVDSKAHVRSIVIVAVREAGPPKVMATCFWNKSTDSDGLWCSVGVAGGTRYKHRWSYVDVPLQQGFPVRCWMTIWHGSIDGRRTCLAWAITIGTWHDIPSSSHPWRRCGDQFSWCSVVGCHPMAREIPKQLILTRCRLPLFLALCSLQQHRATVIIRRNNLLFT
jgi:hypothetical protein